MSTQEYIWLLIGVGALIIGIGIVMFLFQLE
jgi:hypothetical protein